MGIISAPRRCAGARVRFLLPTSSWPQGKTRCRRRSRSSSFGVLLSRRRTHHNHGDVTSPWTRCRSTCRSRAPATSRSTRPSGPITSIGARSWSSTAALAARCYRGAAMNLHRSSRLAWSSRHRTGIHSFPGCPTSSRRARAGDPCREPSNRSSMHFSPRRTGRDWARARSRFGSSKPCSFKPCAAICST